MGKDKRGIDRGRCEQCDCDEYEVLSNERILCDYCGHPPMSHRKRSLIDDQKSAPKRFKVDEEQSEEQQEGGADEREYIISESYPSHENEPTGKQVEDLSVDEEAKAEQEDLKSVQCEDTKGDEIQDDEDMTKPSTSLTAKLSKIISDAVLVVQLTLDITRSSGPGLFPRYNETSLYPNRIKNNKIH